MHFSATFLSLLIAGAVATPTPISFPRLSRRDLNPGTYDQFQISDGVAGNAEAEAGAKFQLATTNFTQVSDQDLQTLKSCRETAENAEIAPGGFNDQIAQANGTQPVQEQLKVGKVKNKVLKLKLEVLILEIELAKLVVDVEIAALAIKIEKEKKKLLSNILKDKKNKGKKSKGVKGKFRKGKKEGKKEKGKEGEKVAPAIGNLPAAPTESKPSAAALAPPPVGSQASIVIAPPAPTQSSVSFGVSAGSSASASGGASVSVSI